jgi:hypothetical protein
VSAPATATAIAGTHQRSSANARVCCDQPTGDSHEHQRACVESPTARSRKAAPIRAEVIPLAARAASVN